MNRGGMGGERERVERKRYGESSPLSQGSSVRPISLYQDVHLQ